MKKKTKVMQKAANGLQRIKADNASTRGMITAGLSAGADAILPGAGIGIGLLEGVSSSLKDSNGLYKSKAGQVLDNLNPVTAVNTSLNAVGGIFSGKAFRSGFDPTGQNDLRDAIKSQKIKDGQAATWGTATTDVASNSQLSQYDKGSRRIQGKPAIQDSTAPKNIYKGNSGVNATGFADLKRTTKGAAALLSLTKAIPTPLTQGIGWGASGVSALLDSYDAVAAASKGDYKGAAMNAGQAALSLVPLNSKPLTVANKLANSGTRLAKSAALLSDANDIKDAATYNSGSKAIEIEGGEPHFSKKVGGKRSLKMFSATGPSHEQGGIPVLAEQGDAIVTAKGNLGLKAVAAHQRGDNKELETIINQMPADKGSKTAKRGKRKVAPAVSNTLTVSQRAGIKFTPNASVLPDNLFATPNTADDRARQIGQPFRGPDVSMDIYNKNKKAYLPTAPSASPVSTVATKAPGVLGGLANAAPSIYNIGQGLFGDVEKTTRRAYNPSLVDYQDSSGATRQAINQGMRGNVATARNVSGGNAGNVRANTAQAYAQGVSQNASVNSQEAARKLQVGTTNVGIQNEAQLRNNAMNDTADQLDLQNAAKKQEALSKGLEGISGLSQNSQLMANQKAANDANLSNLGQMYRNMELVNGKWVVRKARKGIKKVK